MVVRKQNKRKEGKHSEESRQVQTERRQRDLSRVHLPRCFKGARYITNPASKPVAFSIRPSVYVTFSLRKTGTEMKAQLKSRVVIVIRLVSHVAFRKFSPIIKFWKYVVFNSLMIATWAY
ncbi:hypothetical protein C0J52_17616 [Blattella germanica]|nr:hypothetical protein C0J52_17616 [Blattella germanica]